MTAGARPATVRRPWRAPNEALGALAQLGVSSLRGTATRIVQRGGGFGHHGAPITTGPDRTVLLFYEDVEADAFVRGDRHLARGARRVYHALTRGQQVSGFEIAFEALRTALVRAGCRVVVNNHALARANPEHPVGLCGYPHVLDRWTLPNPAVLGPGLLDHPAVAPRLLDDPRFRAYLVPCDWMRGLFAPYYGDRLRLWFGGIDVEAWPDLAGAPKDIDLLVYDKIRWDRAVWEPALLRPVLAEARRRGLRVETLRRGAYGIDEYRALLGRSRGMLFLCEHETQGIAYQEAMASNVPILAWDPEQWLDPNRTRWTSARVPASSVPYFDASCGERFRDAAAFPAALDRFLTRLIEYAPRRYVRETLSLERSAALYLDTYTQAARPVRWVTARRGEAADD